MHLLLEHLSADGLRVHGFGQRRHIVVRVKSRRNENIELEVLIVAVLLQPPEDLLAEGVPRGPHEYLRESFPGEVCLLSLVDERGHVPQEQRHSPLDMSGRPWDLEAYLVDDPFHLEVRETIVQKLVHGSLTKRICSSQVDTKREVETVLYVVS